MKKIISNYREELLIYLIILILALFLCIRYKNINNDISYQNTKYSINLSN